MPVSRKGELVYFTEGTKIANIYGNIGSSIENFNCSFGLNPLYESTIINSQLKVGALNELSQIRAIELVDHPFFIGTLFQPERLALKNIIHPLINSFLKAVFAYSTLHHKGENYASRDSLTVCPEFW